MIFSRKCYRLFYLFGVLLLVLPAGLNAQSSQPSSAASSYTTTHGASPTTEGSFRPFSTVGVAAKFGIGGIGFDAATPIAQKFNLRGGATFFGYSTSIHSNDITYNASLQLRSGQILADWFPLGGSFRVSGGLNIYNGNQVTGSATLVNQQSFTLNSISYTATGTVRADASVVLGNKVGPMVTVGFGNLVPRRRNKHISVPVEVGFFYTGAPKINLNFTGNVCDNLGNCQPIANNTIFMQNVTEQENKYKSDLNALRVFPVLSVGFGYKF